MKTIVITGVGKGFGRDLFLHLLNGYRVIGITRSEADCDSLQMELKSRYPDNKILCLDVNNSSQVELQLLPLLDEFKDDVFGLINNAGIRCRKRLADLSMEEIREVCDVNLFAPIHLSKLILPYFVSNGCGRIINVSSIISQSALPELAAYAVSKAGLDGFTRSVTAEFAKYGVTCNSILPGFCKTSYFDKFKRNEELYQMTLQKTPAARWGESTEIIGLCELLLSEQGGYINGTSIPVDGGWLSC